MQAKIRKVSPKTIEVERSVSISISGIRTNDEADELKDLLKKELPKIVAKTGGQLTIEESEKKSNDD